MYGQRPLRRCEVYPNNPSARRGECPDLIQARETGQMLRIAVVIIALAAAPVAAADEAVLRSAVIDGSTVYGPQALFATYRNELGRPIAGDTAKRIAATIA